MTARSMSIRAGALALALLAAAPGVDAQEDGSSLDSYHRARAVVEAGLTALGSPAPGPLSFTLRGTRSLRGQGIRPDVAEEFAPRVVRVALDPARDRAMMESETNLPGGIRFVFRQVAEGSRGFMIDVPRTRLGPALLDFPAAAVRTQVNRLVPHLLLRQALARPATLRDLGTVERGGIARRAVAFATEQGALLTLFFDATTSLPSGYELLEDVAARGDVVTEGVWSEYALAGTMRLPGRYVVRQNGTVDQDVRYEAVAVGAAPADSLFARPEGYAPPPAGGPPAVSRVAEGVWMLERLDGDSRALFVDLGDHVLVVEAPGSSAVSEQAMELIRATVPDKPVRYLVVTHRHADHIGGVRPYVAAGAVLVAPRGAEAALRDFAGIRRTLGRQDALDRAPREPVIETVAERRTFAGAGRRVEVIQTGGGAHVDSELVVYLPDQRLLFQGDFVTFPDFGGDAPDLPVTRELATLIRRLELEVETIAGVHGRLGTLADLHRAVSPASTHAASQDR